MISIPRLPFREDKVFSVLVLLTLIVPLVFDWQLYEKYEIIKLAAWMVILGAAAFLFFTKKIHFFKNHFFYILLAAFIFFGFLSSIFSISPLNSFFGFYPRFTSGFLFYILWALTLFIFVNVFEVKRFEFIVRVIFFDAAIIAVVGILQSFGIGYYEGINQVFITRAPGLLGNPNFTSMFLAAVVPFALPLIQNAKTFKSKLYYVVSAVLMLWAIVNFSSRGTFLALAVGLLFGFILLLLIKPSKKFIFGALGALVVFCGLIFVFAQVTRPGSITAALKLSEINIDTRLFAWDTARQAVFSHPLLGYGPGNLQIYFENFRSSNLAQEAGVFDDAHNLLLQMAATTGVPFMLSFCVLLGLGCWFGYKILRQDTTNFYAVACLTALVIWFLASCFNPVSSANFYLLAIILAGLSVLYNHVKLEISIKPLSSWLLRIACLVLSLAGLIFIVSESLFYSGYVYYLNNQFANSQKYLNWAGKINPTNQLYFLYSSADEVILNPDAGNLKKNISYIVSLQPKSAKSYVMAANLSYLMFDKTGKQEFLEQGIEYMQKSLTMDKYFTPRYTHLGFYLAEAGKIAEARETVKTGLMFNPLHLPSWLLLARIYQLEKKAPQSAYALNQAFQLQPNDAYLKELNQKAKEQKNFSDLKIPALINIFQIEP